MDAIVTTNLRKCYGWRAALCRLNLRVRAGGLFGFLGPNGAGKTTTIRLLLGLLRPTSGQATVLGRDVWCEGPRLRASVGYLPGDVRFYDGLTGRATLRFLNAARGGGTWGEVLRLTRELDLDLDRRVRDYSRGMKQKLGIIAALMHRPQLLVLDEPTTALDPLMQMALYDELRRVAADGRTVLLSSHALAEVEELCDEVAILRSGELIEQERVDVLRQRAARHVELRFRAGAAPTDGLPEGLVVQDRTERQLHGTWRGATEPLVAWLAQNPVEEVTIAPPDLDHLFLTYYAQAPAQESA